MLMAALHSVAMVLQMSVKLPLQPKPVDDILSKEAQWANAQKTEGVLRRANCEKHGLSFCILLQLLTHTTLSSVWQQATLQPLLAAHTIRPCHTAHVQPALRTVWTSGAAPSPPITALIKSSSHHQIEPAPVRLRAAKCGKCGGGEAYFLEVQTRSADEPASLFFRCTRCAHRWREG